MEDRLSKIEAFAADQGIDTRIWRYLNKTKISCQIICNRYKVSIMNPLNEQSEPIMKSYNSDPNNFQMNTILGRPPNIRTFL